MSLFVRSLFVFYNYCNGLETLPYIFSGSKISKLAKVPARDKLEKAVQICYGHATVILLLLLTRG